MFELRHDQYAAILRAGATVVREGALITAYRLLGLVLIPFAVPWWIAAVVLGNDLFAMPIVVAWAMIRGEKIG